MVAGTTAVSTPHGSRSHHRP